MPARFTALQRVRFKLFLRILAVSAVIGAAYGVLRPKDELAPLVSGLVGMVDAVLIAGGIAARVRAALHLGEVITGEVGEQRRAIVFHGDVMNTTSRLEQATREVGCRFIVSADALQALGRPPEFAYRDLGALALRGREEPIRAWGLEPIGT